ncbi:phage portal protein [Amycolatopsis orientalis]|uniref:phage portal protein n=1 Tax=Amycolatopsis orientalis TaxID=31958 RepID=UPI00039F31C5|nr:phage portal protein [Amycolatopsis orientalis]
MATIEDASALVDVMYNELRNRRPAIHTIDRYYRGDHRLKFASEQFAKYHADRYKGFADNWVPLVSDAPVERLTWQGIHANGEAQADKEIWRVWQTNGLDVDSQLGFLGAINSGRSFVLVWGNPDDEQTPMVTFEDASQCIIAYVPGSRRLRRAALKTWQDGNREFATLYLPDEVWKFERPLSQNTKTHADAAIDEELDKWATRDMGDSEPNPQPNPMGVVPMVELQNKPTLLADPISDVTGVISMQDGVNLLWSLLFTASDYAGFKQRLILGAERPMIPILDDKGTVIGERPVDMERFAIDRIAFVTDENAKVAEFSETNLTAFTEIIETAIGHIAAQTRTPQHYLIGKIANLSSDALIAAEGGLVKRTQEKQLWFGAAIREAAALIALAQGNTAKAEALRAGRSLWADEEFRSQSQLADALLKLSQVGFPFEYLAAKWGLTPQEVAEVVEMRRRQAETDPIAEIARNLNAPNSGTPGEGPTQPVQGDGQGGTPPVGGAGSTAA